jgi:hypothetical protein
MDNDEKPKEGLSKVDYAILMRGTLTQIQDVIEAKQDKDEQDLHLNNLVATALDYLFYLEDNRRVII